MGSSCLMRVLGILLVIAVLLFAGSTVGVALTEKVGAGTTSKIAIVGADMEIDWPEWAEYRVIYIPTLNQAWIIEPLGFCEPDRWEETCIQTDPVFWQDIPTAPGTGDVLHIHRWAWNPETLQAGNEVWLYKNQDSVPGETVPDRIFKVTELRYLPAGTAPREALNELTAGKYQKVLITCHTPEGGEFASQRLVIGLN